MGQQKNTYVPQSRLQMNCGVGMQCTGIGISDKAVRSFVRAADSKGPLQPPLGLGARRCAACVINGQLIGSPGCRHSK
jgi:bacterioferritin-associated ferredoxin